MLGLFLGGCPKVICPNSDPATLPPPQDAIRNIRVLELHIPKEDADLFPELRERRIAYDLAHYLWATLDETGRFRFFEGTVSSSKDLLGVISQLWELTDRGLNVRVEQRTPIEQRTPSKTPDLLVYTKLFDFVKCDAPRHHIGLLDKEQCCETRVGVQVRMTDLWSTEVVAQGTTDFEKPCGMYRHSNKVPLWSAPGFPQSAFGIAANRAIRCVVDQALRKADERGSLRVP
jgi:hypothetical protein